MAPEALQEVSLSAELRITPEHYQVWAKKKMIMNLNLQAPDLLCVLLLVSY